MLEVELTGHWPPEVTETATMPSPLTLQKHSLSGRTADRGLDLQHLHLPRRTAVDCEYRFVAIRAIYR